MKTILILLLCSIVWAKPSVELVLTIPVETNLEVAGIRDGQTVWLEMIREAKSSLYIEQFYITDEADEPLRPVLDAIRDAGARGVQIRLIADSKFFKTYPQWVKEVGNYSNAEARTVDFNPGVQHAKFFIVDHEQVFVGSHNFDWRALKHIHEVGVRVKDSAVAAKLESVFEMDWAAGVTVSGRTLPKSLQPPLGDDLGQVRILASPIAKNPKGIEDTLSVILEKIKNAKASVSIQLYEYSTKVFGKSTLWKTLQDAMIEAARRGVQVRVLVDATSVKKDKAGLVALAKEKNILVKSVTIPQYSGGPIEYARLVHSKYMIVDQSVAWVGTENWSNGYFENSRNVGMMFTDVPLAKNLGMIFDRLWENHVSTAVGP